MTKSSDKFSFDELRRANERPLPKQVPPPQRHYDYYEAHPEHRPRRQTRRTLRRRLTREG